MTTPRTAPDADVVISGGGLAASVTALLLARRGVSVVMVERAVFPRDKPCGEGLLPHGVDTLEALGLGDVLTTCDAQPFSGILYRCQDVVAPGDFTSGIGRGVRRRALDAALQARAVAAGARLETGLVRGVDMNDDGGALVLASGQRLRGRVVVGADGPRSIVRHGLGLDGGVPRRPRYALRQHFSLRAEAPMPSRVEVTALPGHELYVTPVARGLVGVAALCERGVFEQTRRRPADRLRALITGCDAVAALLHGATPASDALACGPLRVRARDIHRGRAVLIGDAAGYVDAITGEGMSLALRSAVSAADAIAEVLDGVTPEIAFARYRAARARMFRDHALLTFGLVELARRPALARRTIAALARDPALFSRLLEVNDGKKRLFDLSVADLLRLALGARPRPAALPARVTPTSAE